MNDDQLQFDRTCHVIYSKPCKAEIREKIAHHYPESQREAVWERVQMQYVKDVTSLQEIEEMEGTSSCRRSESSASSNSSTSTSRFAKSSCTARF